MENFLRTYLPNASEIPQEFIEATKQTLYMSFWTSLIAGIIGLFFGILLLVTRPSGLLEQRFIYECLDKLINVIRSIPFIILLSLLAVVTRFIIGSTIGTKAALVPLIFGVVPFFARQVENALLDVDPGVVEAAQAMGSSPVGIIFRVYLVEGSAGLIRVSALTIINVIGLTTMAGAIGAGGLGSLAITRGYNRFQTDVTIVATLLILLLVFVSQFVSNLLIKKVSH